MKVGDLVKLSHYARNNPCYTPQRFEDIGIIYRVPYFGAHTIMWASDFKISINIDERDLVHVGNEK